MFNPGQRISVLNSNVPKDKTGPKKGSIGYIVDTAIIHVEKRDKFIYALVRINAVFSRFGHEKKKRQEEKTIIAIMPINIGKRQQKSFTVVDDMAKRIDQDDLSGFFSPAMAAAITGGSKASAICLVAASSDNVDFKTDFDSLACWIESMCRNESKYNSGIFEHYVSASNVRRPNIVDYDVVRAVNTLSHDRDGRLNLLETIKKKGLAEGTVKMITGMKIVHMLCIKGFSKRFLKSFVVSCNVLQQQVGKGASMATLKKSDILPQMIDCCDNPYLLNKMSDIVKEIMAPNETKFDRLVNNIRTSYLYLKEMADEA